MRGVDIVAVLALGMVTVVDVLYLNARESAAEYAPAGECPWEAVMMR